MTDSEDPYRHHPELRGRIRDPETSWFRSIDFDALDRVAAEAGKPDWRHPHDLREANRRAVLQGRRDADLWVFGYGSLIWDPAFRFAELRFARLQGYHRTFCMRTDLGRGSPERPGLMAGLDLGGRCEGFAFRIPRDRLEEETAILWQREFLLPGYVPTFVALDAGGERVEALTCVMDRSLDSYMPGLTEDDMAAYLGTASGVLGTNLDYIETLVEHLQAIGLDDPFLVRLRDKARAVAASA